MSARYAIAVHGGAGTVSPEILKGPLEKTYRDGIQHAVVLGQQVLMSGGTALEAVEQAVRALEDLPYFNAGRGSAFNADGQHEMDAAIMCGRTLDCGAVAGVQNVKNPVTLAKRIMDTSGHVMLSGFGAFEFAHKQKINLEDDQYFFDQIRYDQWKKGDGRDVHLSEDRKEGRSFGTVGAVALDVHGDLAAATSTGGTTNKRYQRIGDSAIIGAGTYANNATCAVSCTGSGEAFIKSVAAHGVHARMAFGSMKLQDAVRQVVHEELPKLNGDGGMIAIDGMGNVVLDMNCSSLYRGFAHGAETPEVALFR